MTLEELQADHNWMEVFADPGNCSDGNCDKTTDVVGQCSPDPSPTRADVVRILASRDGFHDADDWIGVFELRDGRYLFARGGCDLTGWD